MINEVTMKEQIISKYEISDVNKELEVVQMETVKVFEAESPKDDLETDSVEVIELTSETEKSEPSPCAEDMPNLCALATSLVQRPLEEDDTGSEKRVDDGIMMALSGSDFRLMESFRSHYVVDISSTEENLGEQFGIEQKEDVDKKTNENESEQNVMEKQGNVEEGTKHFMLKMTESTGSKVESVEEEQESGLEITVGREHKSYEDSTIMDHSSEFFGSDRTDSLLQESTLHESYLMEKTLSQQTLEAEFPTETVECIFDTEKTSVEGKVVQKEGLKKKSLEASFTDLIVEHSKLVEEKQELKQETELLAFTKPTETSGEVKLIEQKMELTFSELQTTGFVKISENEQSNQQNLVLDSPPKPSEIEVTSDVDNETVSVEIKGVSSETNVIPIIERKIHDHSKTAKEKPSFVPSPITETVELTPILSWELETGADKFEELEDKDIKQIEISGMSMRQLEPESPRGSTDSPSSSPPNASRCSSYMTERSGTQSSIEVRSSSKSSHHTSSSRASSYLDSEEKSETKSSISIQERSTSNTSSSLRSGSSPPKSSRCTDESSLYSHISTSHDSEDKKETKERTSSESSGKHVKLSDLSPDVAPRSVSEVEERPGTETSSSPPRKSPVSQLQQDALSGSAHSLPSSPRKLQRTHSSGVKKLTSELFSTESDICRSLELVYVEPGENSRRKLSERYRHSSSSGNSDGSIAHEVAGQESPASAGKLEKRKPSVTRIRKSSDVSKESSGPSSLVTTDPEQDQIERSKTSSSEPYDLQHKTETMTGDSCITKSPTSSPPPSSSDKKVPSPTKIRPPFQSTASLKEQISEEIISPVLEVECHTPVKSSMLSSKGKGGCYLLEGLR
jgi:hypothetical protein